VAIWPFKPKKRPPPPPPLAYSWSGDGVGRPEPPRSYAWLWTTVVIFLVVLLLAWVVPALAAPMAVGAAPRAPGVTLVQAPIEQGPGLALRALPARSPSALH
jgi:hypothetical protein